jgi:hypothetical protein
MESVFLSWEPWMHLLFGSNFEFFINIIESWCLANKNLSVVGVNSELLGKKN